MNIVLLKTAFSLVLTLGMLIVPFTADRWPLRRWYARSLTVLGLGITVRLGLFGLAYLVLHLPIPSDVPLFVERATSASSGLLPYRDFYNEYAPLFPYVLTLGISANEVVTSHNVLFIMTAADSAVFLALWIALRRSLSPSELLKWSVLYTLCPLSYIYSVLGGQEDIWVLGIYVLALLVILSKHEHWGAFLSGAGIALGILVTKTTSVFPVGLLLGIIRCPAYFFMGIAAVGLVFLPMLLAIGDSITTLMRITWPDAPSIWFILQALTGGAIQASEPLFAVLSLIGTLIVSVFLWGVAWKQHVFALDPSRRIRVFMCMWVVLWTCFSLITPKGLTNYLVIWIGPAIMILVLHRQSWSLWGSVMVLSSLGAVHSTLSYRLSGPQRYTDISEPLQAMFILLDIVILSTYVICARAAWQQLRIELQIQREGV